MANSFRSKNWKNYAAAREETLHGFVGSLAENAVLIL
jgi:hypothetical protein